MLERAIELTSRLVSEYPSSVEDRLNLAKSERALGRLQSLRGGMLNLSIASFSKSIEVRQDVVHEFPGRLDQVYELAYTLGELAFLHQIAGDLQKGSEDANRALELLKELDRRFPDTPQYQTRLYLTYDTASHLRNLQGDSAGALQFAELARTILERLLVKYPKAPAYVVDLSRCHDFIGRLLTHTGIHADALRSFQRAVDVLESLSKLDPADYYQLAISLASCISLIGPAPEPPLLDYDSKVTPGDRLRRDLYAKRAVVALSLAVSGGFGSLQMYLQDPDLDPLRERADFQKLLNELAKQDKTSQEASSQ
jgi:tetratricopeptide (TPR) repeat protein